MLSFSEYLLMEAAYKGNIGMMEMFKFFQVATEKQKRKLKALIKDKKESEAWKFLQDVVNVKLET